MRYWLIIFGLGFLLALSVSAPRPAHAAALRQGTVTPTPPAACCPAPSGQLLASCSTGPGPGVFNAYYYLELYNTCPDPIVGTIQDTLSVSSDSVTWEVFATSVPRPITVPTYTPGPPPVYNGGFSNLSIPNQYMYYRLSAAIQPDGACAAYTYGSPAQLICRSAVTPHPSPSNTPVPSATPTATTTPTVPPCFGPDNAPLCTTTPLPFYTYTPSATPTATRTPTVRPCFGPNNAPLCTPLPAWTATASITPSPSATASASPTTCARAFSDVPPGHPFYAYVYCLACRGIVSGYADGTFRPYANVIRGAAAKLVANSAYPSAPVPSDRQTFADVPGSFPFWLYIEQLAAHGVVGGYTCGGPGEPCDPQQRPYFRPYAEVTRGQLAKMLVLAAALPGPPAGQTFADVPPDHPFYAWVEMIAPYPIFSGYTCGGPGEPCDPPQRPYFRPYAPATRGQTAKLVANTFHPGCATGR